MKKGLINTYSHSLKHDRLNLAKEENKQQVWWSKVRSKVRTLDDLSIPTNLGHYWMLNCPVCVKV
jgi:uncharacterized protein YaeQ